MTETSNDSEQVRSFNLLQYSHPAMHFTHGDGETGSLRLPIDITGNGDNNGNIFSGDLGQKKDSDESIPPGNSGATDTLYGASDNTDSIPEVSTDGTEIGVSPPPQCLDDYKCPICLDTFINTVKVDCSYGHKFCNFCIQCWINFERHLVTECPVCRGPIFGKSLDLKTDAEIREIFDSLPEEEKRTRLLAIKERLQLEYPSANPQQLSTGFQIPMRYSDAPHHHFNHDLHISIPLHGVMEGEAMSMSNNLQENGLMHGYGENNPQVWSQGMYYPPTWNNGSYIRDYQYMNSIPQPYLTPNFEHPDADVHHQHFHHQNQENSRWDNNLYVTLEDTTVLRGPSSSGHMLALTSASHPQMLDQVHVDANGQNHLHGVSSRPHAFQNATGIQHNQQSSHFSFLHEQQLNNSPINYSAPAMRSAFQSDQFLTSVSPHAHASVPQATAQPRLMTPNHVNGFYCCYPPTCPGHHHCTTPTTQFISHSMLQAATCGHMVPCGCSGHRHHNIQCSTEVGSSNTPIEPNSCHVPSSGNVAAMSHMPPRIRPNMPGTSSTSIQLPSPSIDGRCRFRSQVASHSNSSSTNGSNSNNAPPPPPPQSRIRQPAVSRCPSRNSRAHFSGGFSLFTSGYMGFQISHVPTSMMIGDRYVSTPPARLTHPLVSLIPLNQDGSSTRVCLTFEVHHV